MKTKMIFKGFKFGTLLQLAVGPICIFIFNKAISQGVIIAMFGVIGVVIIDGLYITLSIIGVSTLVKRNEKIIRFIGSAILIIFGCNIIYNALITVNSINYSLEQGGTYLTTFIKAIVLTGANPLTIVFWSGVFSSKIVEENFTRNDEILFGIGAVLSTFIWLTIVCIIGQFTNMFLNNRIVIVLNALVGVLLIFFGIRLLVKNNVSVSQ